jgi:hypothetical protein
MHCRANTIFEASGEVTPLRSSRYCKGEGWMLQCRLAFDEGGGGEAQPICIYPINLAERPINCESTVAYFYTRDIDLHELPIVDES